MNSKIINVITFAAGAAIGSVVTWKLVKTKYENIAREEIESVKETFAEYFATNDDTTETEETEEDEERPSNHTRQINWSEYEDLDDELDEYERAEIDEYEADEADRVEYEKLTGYYTIGKGGVATMNNDNDSLAKEPYVISPYDFASLDDWKQVSLTYYADDILEDDYYNVIGNRDELIGAKALTTFGEYEDDSVFVRNERLKTDFEILKDPRTYDQARSTNPDRVDNE